MGNTFLAIDEQQSRYDAAACVVLPLPYEQTTSYGQGTAGGPRAIIEASAYVELFDEVYGCEIYKKGIHTDEPLRFSGRVEQDFRAIEQRAARHLANDKFIVALGGEHSVSFPLYRAFHQKYDDLTVVQFDAHSDLRDSYEGSIYSHASVMKRIYDLNPRIVQLGIRSQCAEEAELIKKEGIQTVYAHKVRTQWPETVSKLRGNIYITFDVDFWDPSIMPATGTPEPGGFLWDETLEVLEAVFKAGNVVGCDVVELSPLRGLSHPDFTTAKLVHKLITLKLKEQT
ncbi:MAG TPA: agmatinase [Caldithrix abyssi]|uniref:Agmatinase n=1 Tax=Caldithrix abyssi TaxID=187145 RepID=A0A7V5RQU2_CALAY|nr:agmatinase [Caldithrix abyssi]